jgi:periplasmic protein TonB
VATSRKSSPARAASTADSRISIVDLRASGMTLRWQEVVAIVQGICRAISDSHEPARGGLDPDQVFIELDGTITLDARPDPAAALPQLKKLLIDMLPPNEFAQAKSIPDSSLEEFSRGLEYYERPNRQEVIQSVRARWRPGQVRAVEDFVDPASAKSQESESESEKKDAPRGRWLGRLIATAAFIAAIAGGAAMAARTTNLERKIRNYASVISSTVNQAQATEQAPPTEAKPEPAKDVRPAPVKAHTPKPAAVEPPRADVPAPAPAEHFAMPKGVIVSGVTRPAPAPAGQPVSPSTPIAPTVFNAPAASETQTAPVRVAAADPPINPRVFDASQSDVTPPVFVYPDSRQVYAPGSAPKDAPSIEITVNERGTIDTVKTSNAPRTIAESMQLMTDLSAAKNWRFRPAMRDGYPVRFRLLVPIIVR